MRAQISATAYHDEAIFSREGDNIFARGWAFACFYSSVREHNSWVTAKVAGRSIVIQNFSGELRCFLNVCSHRFCEIRLSPAGKDPLRCSYHGWTYDSDGIPFGIPHRPRFEGLTPECIRSLALRHFRVERCGELVFVCLSEQALSLNESMGSFFGEIETLSGQMGDLVDISEWKLECNWKILVENTLEAYHVDFVHPSSFSKLNAKFGDFRFDSLAHSFLGRTDMENTGFGKFVAGFQTRPHKVEGYLHLSLFPNFLMSTSYGIVFSVQQIVPLSARTTHMTSYLFHRPVDTGSRVTGGMLELMHESAVAFNRQVLTEDQQICEAVQRGVRQMGEATGILSEEELRIAAFHETYASFMPSARLQDSGNEA